MSDDSARLQTDLVRLVDQGRRPDKTLVPRAPATAIPTGVGVARPQRPTAGNADEGIAAPLTEVGSGGVATTRTYHASTLIYSSNGMVAVKRRPIAGLDFLDAQGRTVGFVFQQPPD